MSSIDNDLVVIKSLLNCITRIIKLNSTISYYSNLFILWSFTVPEKIIIRIFNQIIVINFTTGHHIPCNEFRT